MTKAKFDKIKHKTLLVKILKEIYSDPELRNCLSFKGGTAAYLFYNLPRPSIDLDFDLLNSEKQSLVFKKLKKILPRYGELLDATEKRYTLFFLVRYAKGDRNIKIEISKRPVKTNLEVKNYLGISVLLVSREDMLAGKLAAFLTRKKFAARDLFDLWFFLKEEWQINEGVIKEKTGLTLNQALKKAIQKLMTINKNQLLQGLGDLLDNKQKEWVREKLKTELLFYLRLYQA